MPAVPVPEAERALLPGGVALAKHAEGAGETVGVVTANSSSILNQLSFYKSGRQYQSSLDMSKPVSLAAAPSIIPAYLPVYNRTIFCSSALGESLHLLRCSAVPVVEALLGSLLPLPELPHQRRLFLRATPALVLKQVRVVVEIEVALVLVLKAPSSSDDLRAGVRTSAVPATEPVLSRQCSQTNVQLVPRLKIIPYLTLISSSSSTSTNPSRPAPPPPASLAAETLGAISPLGVGRRRPQRYFASSPRMGLASLQMFANENELALFFLKKNPVILLPFCARLNH